MAELGEGALEATWAIPLLKQGHQSQQCRMTPQGWRYHNLSGQPGMTSASHPHREEVYSDDDWREEEKKCLNTVKTGDCKWKMKKDKGEEQIMESAHPRASRQRAVYEKSKIMLKQIRRKYSTERF